MRNQYLLLVAALIVSTGVNAAVISNTNILLYHPAMFSDYALRVFQDEAATDPTTMWFNALGPTISFVTMDMDEGSDWYLASLGDSFSRDSIQNSEFPTLVSGNPLFVGFGDFYLGINTGNGIWVYPDIPRNLYGWVHLQSIGGTITMLDNAMSYQGSGIVIGTTEVIPEPSVSRMLVLSLLLAHVFWRTLEEARTRRCRQLIYHPPK